MSKETTDSLLSELTDRVIDLRRDVDQLSALFTKLATMTSKLKDQVDALSSGKPPRRRRKTPNPRPRD